MKPRYIGIAAVIAACTSLVFGTVESTRHVNRWSGATVTVDAVEVDDTDDTDEEVNDDGTDEEGLAAAVVEAGTDDEADDVTADDDVTGAAELTSGGVVAGPAAEGPVQADSSIAAPTTSGPADLMIRPVMRVLPIRGGWMPRFF